MRKIILTRSIRKVLGIVLAVIGGFIVIYVVPLKIWVLILGFLLIFLGWTIYRMI
ncbi:hypothetical protein [Thermohalobacter berrensis]|uniref:hypothetical protein n=1 Tax=Thermohalobacter berrensis TaxID=99594 RepID=UPI0016045BA6|nr:hypothetical protein [Thermohalobacter berrensis]